MSVDHYCATTLLHMHNSIERIVSGYVDLHAEGNILRGLCPFHDEKTASFTVYNDTQSWYCFGCSQGGDGIDFLMKIEDCNFIEAKEALGGYAYHYPPKPIQRLSKEANRVVAAKSLWLDCASLESARVERKYLERRGIPFDVYRDLPNIRCCSLPYKGDGREHDTIVAAVRNGDDELQGVQRIYLSRDGSKLHAYESKMSLGKIKGGAIKLGETTDTITICEGLEDGLTHRLWNPDVTVWVSAGASNLVSMPIPDSCTRLVIAADNDPVGLARADHAADVYRRNGRDISIVWPDEGFKDFNDQLLGKGFRDRVAL